MDTTKSRPETDTLKVGDKEGIIRYIEVLKVPGDMPDNEDLFEALRKL